jgi:hypothetical protein
LKVQNNDVDTTESDRNSKTSEWPLERHDLTEIELENPVKCRKSPIAPLEGFASAYRNEEHEDLSANL